MTLEIKNIKKSFGSKEVLRGLSFSAEGGKAFGLLGRNGAGKTTSIRILMDVFPPDEGEVLFDGRPIDYDKLRIGYLPEERGLYPKRIISEQLTYFAALKGMSKRDAAISVDKWLDRLGVAEYKSKKLETLSKGNQQKIQLITALAHDPHIIVLDEPFSGLDPVNAMLLKDVIKEEIAKGKIVLFSSHQMNYIEEFCDGIAILNEGLAAISGRIDDIKKSRPRDKLVVSSRENARIKSEIRGCTDAEKGEIIIKLDSENDKMSMMNRLTAGYDVDEIRVYEPSLNDIFIEYAGSSPSLSEDKNPKEAEK